MLTEAQRVRLVALADEWLSALVLPIPRVGITEREFTGRHLYPLVADWVASLESPRLVVRADGALPPRRLTLEETTFVPDIEIGEHHERYVAIEVKLLRSSNSSASFTKAIGQGVVYRSLGFRSSHVVLVDLRPTPSPSVLSAAHWEVLAGAGLSVHWFRGTEGYLHNVRRSTLGRSDREMTPDIPDVNGPAL